MFLKYFCKRSFKVHVGNTLKDPTESNDFTLWCNVNFSFSGFDLKPEVDCFRNRKLTKCSFSKKRLDAFYVYLDLILGT